MWESKTQLKAGLKSLCINPCCLIYQFDVGFILLLKDGSGA